MEKFKFINWRMTRSPCVQCSGPRHRRWPGLVWWVCCWGSSQGCLSLTRWSGEPSTRQSRLSSHYICCPPPRCTEQPSVLSRQQRPRSARPSERPALRKPGGGDQKDLKIPSPYVVIWLCTCKILETLLPFSMTQNWMKRQGRQSSLFSWLGLA